LDEEVPLVVNVLEHYHAYLVASKREDSAYQALSERPQRKGPEKAEGKMTEKRKKA
jgi:hypothetical protein